MAWLDGRVKRGTWVAVFCGAGAIAAACGSNPSVTNSGGAGSGFGGDGNSGNGGIGGTAATGNNGLAATGNIVVPDGGDPGTGGGIVATALVFDPETVTLTLGDAGAVKTASYTLKATIEGGAMLNVTAESLEFDRPDIASFALGPPALLTATGSVAGKGTLHAVFGGKEATAALIVNLVESHVDGTIPKAALDGLGADSAPADPTLKTLLYPYDKTVFPLGLASPKIMFSAPNAGDFYRIHLEQKGYKYDYYAAATAPGQMTVPQDAWDRVTASNTGDPLTLTLSRWDTATSLAYTSASETLTIAPESLAGAIYYWSATGDGVNRVGYISQLYPGAGAVPKKLNEGKCMGCHSVSADGSTLVATIEDPSAPSVAPYSNWSKERAWASFALPDATLSKQTTKSGANSALTPDGKYVVFGGRSDLVNGAPVPGSKYLSLAPTATGDVIAASGLDDLVLSSTTNGLMMPAFAPDGSKLAAVEAGGDLSDNVIPSPSVRIVYMDFDQATTKFDSTVHEVVKASDLPVNNDQLGYPSFSPDGKYIAYHSGKYSTGCHDSCLDDAVDSGELWVSATSGGTPIRMAALDDPPAAADHNTQREPTFCPISRGGYSWVVFTSMRDWGNEHVGPVNNGKRRLWVAAIDTELGTMDPSHPPFYVEGQDDKPNMRGFWALAKCIETPPAGETGTMCKANFECCSGFCVDGQCVDKSMLSCAGVGDACKAAKDCCNAGVTDCVSDVCTIPVVPK